MLVSRIFEWIEQQGWDCYLVGGFIRERLRGRMAHDIDLVVPGQATRLGKQLARQFKGNFVVLDAERDTVRVIIEQQYTVDIACYTGENLLADLHQRDLTINAIAAPIQQALLGPLNQFPDFIDPCGGMMDLKQGLIRGIQIDNFRDDPLRLLRIFRFAATLDFRIDPLTWQWVCTLANQIVTVAPERVLNELEGILKTSHASRSLIQLEASGLLGYLIPEFQKLKTRPMGHPTEEGDVLHDAMNTLFQLEQLLDNVTQTFSSESKQIEAYLSSPLSGQRPRIVAIKLGILFIYLNLTESHGQNSGTHRGEHLIDEICERLKLGNHEKKLILVLTFQHDRLIQLLIQAAISNSDLYLLYHELGIDIIGLVLVTLAMTSGCPEDNLERGKVNIFAKTLLSYYCDAENPLAHPIRLLSGQDLIVHLTIPPGPQIGKLLMQIALAQAEGMIQSKAEALAFAKMSLANNSQ